MLRFLLLAALVAAGVGATSQKSDAVGSFANGAVADAAETYANGSYGNWCKVFGNNAVKAASGNTINLTGYQQGYANAGGIEVAPADAVRGDIIQVTPNGSVDSNVEWYYDQGRTALHTAIILTNNGGNSFGVIDSNWGNDMKVQRHPFNPYSWAASKPYGGIVKIWRMGTVTPPPPPPPPPPPRDTTTNGTDKSIAGDFNGDGYGDVVALYDYGSSDTGVWLFAGSSSGLTTPGSLQWRSGQNGFTQSKVKAVALTHPSGPDDLVVFYDYGNSDLGVWRFSGSSSGLSAPSLMWRTGSGHWDNSRASLIGGDFNNDGHGDVAALYGYAGNQAAIFTYQGTASGLSSVPASNWVSQPAAWDWTATKVVARQNASAADDMVIFYDYGSNDVGLWESHGGVNGLQGLATTPTWRSGPGQWNLLASKLMGGSFNSDSYGDIAVWYDYGGSNTALFMFNGQSGGVQAPAAYKWETGPGTFSWTASKPFAVSKGAGSQTVDDIVVWYNYGSSDTGIWQFPDAGSARSLLWRPGVGSWSWGSM